MRKVAVTFPIGESLSRAGSAFSLRGLHEQASNIEADIMDVLRMNFIWD